MDKSNYEQKLEAKVKKGKEVFIANNATVLGEVTLGDHASVWYQAVIRGDNDRIDVGSRTNIQDGAVLHVDPGYPVYLGRDVVIGHNAIIHGAVVADHSLIGMGATVLNGAEVGNYCIIGANALVTGGTVIPDYSMVLGSPAKVVRQIKPEEMKGIEENAQVYVDKARQYLDLE